MILVHSYYCYRADHGDKITDIRRSLCCICVVPEMPMNDDNSLSTCATADEHLSEVLKHCKAIAKAANLVDYNILQNNGELAHQVALLPLRTDALPLHRRELAE